MNVGISRDLRGFILPYEIYSTRTRARYLFYTFFSYLDILMLVVIQYKSLDFLTFETWRIYFNIP